MLIYVYCMLENQPQVGEVEINKGLEFIEVEDYYVAVKRVSPDEYSEENLKKNFADIQWVEMNAREHIGVICEIMKSQAVIPFKLGTIFNSESGLAQFVCDYSASLSDNFKAINGKEEWSVKIYCDKKKLAEYIPEFNEEVKLLEGQILTSSPGKAFLLKRKRAELIEQEVVKLLKINGQECFDRYKQISQSTRLNNLLPRELTGRDDEMILNAAFFVEKQQVIEFVHIANLQREKYQFAGFSFDVTGPWPPFSFVSVK